jgi:hypothetical protein
MFKHHYDKCILTSKVIFKTDDGFSVSMMWLGSRWPTNRQLFDKVARQSAT